MPTQKIMLIRHAEKPTDDGSIVGVTMAGEQNKEELIVRGWQRSGALARFFAPLIAAHLPPQLATPGVIYASKVAKHSSSLRPQHTVLELATLLNLKEKLDFTKGEESALAAAVVKENAPVLIAWEHQDIPTIVNHIIGNDKSCPQSWPGTRFDIVWILDRQGSNEWRFSQLPQMLLSQDSPSVIPFNNSPQ
jgi:hypothetical protein